MTTTKMLSWDFVQKAILNSAMDEKCEDMHSLTCNQKALEQFVMGCKSVYKMYFLVHFIPFLLFKRQKFIRNPKEELLKFIKGFIKSLLFAGGYSLFIRRIVCWETQFYCFHESSSVISAVFAAFTLNFEPVSRQSEIALFCLNKSMEVSYNMLKRRGWMIQLPGSECWLTAFSLALISFIYLDNPDVFRQSYRVLLDKLMKDI